MSTIINLEFGSPGFLSADPILRVTGTDTIIYMDGRFGRARFDAEVKAHVAYLRRHPHSKYRDMLFVGWTGIGKDRNRSGFAVDPEAPSWVESGVNWETGAGRGVWADLLRAAAKH